MPAKTEDVPEITFLAATNDLRWQLAGLKDALAKLQAGLSDVEAIIAKMRQATFPPAARSQPQRRSAAEPSRGVGSRSPRRRVPTPE